MVRNTYAGSVSPFSPDLKGPKHICRKCLSVFAPPKGKKPTAHICRKCLSATYAGSVSLNPVFGDVFFISKKTILATFRRPKWPLEKRPVASFLKGTLPRSPGARSPALCRPDSKARALKTAPPAPAGGFRFCRFAHSQGPRLEAAPWHRFRGLLFQLAPHVSLC